MAGKPLTALAVKSNVASSIQNHAPNATVFLYRQIWGKGFGWVEGTERAKKPAGLPVLFMRGEERAVLARLDGVRCVMASRLYGSGCGSWRMPAARQGHGFGIETVSSESGFDYKLPCD